MNKNKISNLVHIISGGTPKTSNPDFWNGDIGWLSVADFNNNNRYVYTSEKTISRAGLTSSSTKLLQKNDIIISARGTVGALAQIGIPMCFNQSCFGLRGKEGIIDNTFLYYCLKNYVANIKKRSQGSVFDTINLNTFDLMEIDYPESLSTQQRIASVLAALDNKIELNKCINAELEAMAKNLYDYWFVQCDFPDKNDKPYKSSGGKMFYNDTLKREIPEGWYDSNILAVAQLLGGGTPSKKIPQYWDGKIPFFTPTDANGTLFKFTTEDNITDEGLKNSSTKLFDKNTVFITARGSVGKLVLAGTKMAMNQSCYALKAMPDISYTFLFFLTKELIHHLEVKSSGSVFDSIVSNDIEYTNLAIPEPSLVEKFSNIAEPVFSCIANTTIESEQLAKHRDWLLPMLMNGQVTVK